MDERSDVMMYMATTERLRSVEHSETGDVNQRFKYLARIRATMNLPTFTDLSAVPTIEAAIAAVEAHKGYLRWRDGRTYGDGPWSSGSRYEYNVPDAVVAANDTIDRWKLRDTRLYLNVAATKTKALEVLYVALNIANGQDAKTNRNVARAAGWRDMFLSPDEQALIEQGRL